MALGIPYLRRISFDYLFAAAFFCANGLANGAGQYLVHSLQLGSQRTCRAASTGLSSHLGVWLGFFDWGMNGIGTAVGFAPILSMLLGLIYAMSGHWKKAKLTIGTPQREDESKEDETNCSHG